MNEAQIQARDREHKIRVELYNAATAYGEMVRAKTHDLDTTMKVADRLEAAAAAYAEIAGDREPAALKPPGVSTSASANGSDATCGWQQSAEYKCGEPAEWEMLDEEWREQVPVCSAHADQARSDGFQVRKRQNTEVSGQKSEVSQTTPINCGVMRVPIHSGLRKATGEMKVAASSLCRASDCDDATLWQLDAAYRTLANILDRLESDIPTQTVAERNQNHGQ